MDTKNIVKCDKCGHMFEADNSWAEKVDPGATYPSAASVHSFLMKIKPRLKCSECGSKEITILFEQSPFIKKPSQIPEHEKRYIDEGLPGTREGHKRMRGQQWSDIINRHKR